MRGRRKDYQNGYRGRTVQAIKRNGCLPDDVFALLDKQTRIQYRRSTNTLTKEGVLTKGKTLMGTTYYTLNVKSEVLRSILTEDEIEGYRVEYGDQVRQLRIGMGDKKLKDKDLRRKCASRQSKLINDANSRYIMSMAGVAGKTTPSLARGELTDGTRAYYNSAELKRVYDEINPIALENDDVKNNKVMSSRINGLMVSPGGILPVYSVGNRLIEWKRFGEMKMFYHIRAVINKQEDIGHKTGWLAGQNGSRWYPKMADEDREMVVLSKLDSNFVKICEHEYGTRDKNGERATLMNIDYVYDHMYAIPFNEKGVLMLKIMQEPGWKTKLIRGVLKNDSLIKAKENTSVDCDGYDEEKQVYKLVFCVPDLVKLKNFSRRAQLAEDKDKYEVYCFKHQVPVVAAMLGGSAKTFSIDIEKVSSK